MKVKEDKAKEASRQLRVLCEAWRDFSSYWSRNRDLDELYENDYPFSKSFDEINIVDWETSVYYDSLKYPSYSISKRDMDEVEFQLGIKFEYGYGGNDSCAHLYNELLDLAIYFPNCTIKAEDDELYNTYSVMLRGSTITDAVEYETLDQVIEEIEQYYRTKS